MKKVFAMMAIAAMTLVACDKNNPGNNDDPNNQGGDEQEYVAPITIDGNFDDWAKLEKVQVIKCASTASKTDLKLAKIYSDKYYVFVYVEFDFSAYESFVCESGTNFDFHFNGDNDTSTGGWKGQWDQGETPCIDLMCQGPVIDPEGNVCDYAPGMYKYGGAANTSEWIWEEQPASDFIIGKGNKKGYEFQITRELYPLGKLAKEFGLGIEILVNGWDATGALPNTEATETNPAGEAPLAVVPYTK